MLVAVPIRVVTYGRVPGAVVSFSCLATGLMAFGLSRSTCKLEIVRGCPRLPQANAGQCRGAAQMCPVVVVCRWGSPPDSWGKREM